MAVAAAQVPIYPAYVNPSPYAYPNAYSPSLVYNNQPVIQEPVPVASEIKDNKLNTEAIEKVFGFMAKFITELKANIPAGAIPPVNIPTGAATYPGAVPVNYQPTDVKVEDVEAVFGLLKKFTTQLLANPASLAAVPTDVAPTDAAPAEAAPIEATPPAEAAPADAATLVDQYQLIDTGCTNSVGVTVPCAVRRKRSPQNVVAYNTVPFTYAAQPYTYPVAAPVTYVASEPAVTENKPKIEDIEKVFNLMAKFISELKASIPADAVNIPPVAIPSVVVPAVAIPTGPISGAAISVL